jgi:type IV pilus assembly protein PilZ
MLTMSPIPAGKPAMSRPNVLSLNINSKSALYAAFIPQIKNGGIFIPTSRAYALGDEVFMLLSLMDDPTKLPVAGKVVWVTPPNAQNNRPQGVGIHFNNDNSCKDAKHKIEVILAGALASARFTNTL